MFNLNEKFIQGDPLSAYFIFVLQVSFIILKSYRQSGNINCDYIYTVYADSTTFTEKKKLD